MKDISFYQAQYDLGKSLDTICKEFPEAKRFFLQKNLKFRSKSQAMTICKRKPLSEDHKRKLSIKQSEFLRKNPDMVPYRKYHHSKFESYPEKLFAQELRRRKIVGWVKEFYHSIYSYDFAFVQQKIDVEIDGATHRSERVKIIDAKRDEWSQSLGWRVIRFTASEIQADVSACVDKLQKLF